MAVHRLLSAAALLVALPAAAQVEVMEPGSTAPQYQQPAYAQPAPARAPRAASAPAGGESGLGELYNQVLQLRDEVQQLRGLVEEQGEQLRQLKQQRLDDYIGLDRRITALGGAPAPGPAQDPSLSGAPAASTPSASMPSTGAIRADVPPQAPAAVPAAPLAGEEPAYQAAYELVRARKFPEALAAFNNFLDHYPQGALAGNAHFWIGELYLLNGDSESAKPHYEALVYQFPGNAKSPDGMFKLGRIYHQEGDAARAKELLQRVATDNPSSGSSAPRLAREYLQQNFPGQ